MRKNKAYVYRLYPNNRQAKLLQRTFGCCRFVYNQILTLQQERYKNGEAFLSKTKANNHCNRVLKEEYPFLREVDKFALTNAIWNLDTAFQNFFEKRSGFPKFKSKRKSRNSYTTNITGNNIAVLDNAIKLPKLKAVKAKVHRRPPVGWTVKSATIFQTPSGEYYCSVLFSYEEEENRHVLDTRKSVGLDYKSDGLYLASNGETCGSPKYYRKGQEKLAKEQRKLSRKKPGSRNFEKQKKKVGKAHRHIANQRKDFLHKESLRLAETYDIVCVEDLDMRAMSNKGFGNGKATLDNGYGMFLTFLQYKLEYRGKVLIKVDKYFPSSQLCACCGYQNERVRDLSVREWECPVCHAIHDRDYNAAVNIRREGLRLYVDSLEKTA